MTKYIYSLYDVKTGALAYRGTPAELESLGAVSAAGEASRGWAKQHQKGIVPRKWRIEREEAAAKAGKKKESPGGQMRMIWLYRMYNAAGTLVCDGTAAELTEKGFFYRAEDAANAWRLGHNARLGIVRVEREKVQRFVPTKYSAQHRKREACIPGQQKNAPVPPARKVRDPDRLQMDVHRLCCYNAAARRRGCRELSYGHWKAAGEPAEPV